MLLKKKKNSCLNLVVLHINDISSSSCTDFILYVQASYIDLSKWLNLTSCIHTYLHLPYACLLIDENLDFQFKEANHDI